MQNTSTLQDLTGVEAARHGRITRHVGFGVLLVFVLASFLGLYGPNRKTITTTDGLTELSLYYGSVVRSGQAVPMEITVRRAGGFDGPLTLVFDRDVFDRFDFQNWYPNPSSEVGDGDEVVYEFDPPSGDTLKVALDARVAPTQLGGRHEYSMHIDVGGLRVAETDYVVWVMP
ncbi:MAG TPA: hypothetical protein VFG63_04180 [Nocardioidaceae bacterium]|nr:hypothetical protein [Nocardioidaceae bacterium]